MKFNFKIQEYQTEAVKSSVKVFKGQGYNDENRYMRDVGKTEHPELDESGFKNKAITLSNEELLKNIHSVQNEQNIKLSSSRINDLGSCSLDIEMETGTGKTYVYIKTIFELHKDYGWTKFIVVVPSIAIREGVKKAFEVTSDHFMEHYGKKARYFIYNSSNLNLLDTFSSDAGISVMIINTQAFASSLKEGANNKESRIIYSKRDEFASRRPIDVIKANNPIIILDEPQKMGGEATQNGLKNFNPLFTLNYSATHAKQHNLVYVLDALDAYNQRLVKKIEVKGFEVKNLEGRGRYLYLESIVLSSKKPPVAKIELEITRKTGEITRQIRTCNIGDNLYTSSNEMEQYKGYVISDIEPISGRVIFANGVRISKGDVVGDIVEKDMRRVQIRETIISHFEKEEKLFKMGIKTLSLFFIDEVAKYRIYDESGLEQLGEYGRVFEDEYARIVGENVIDYTPEYQAYLQNIKIAHTHRGYFSIDKKTGQNVNSTIKRGFEFSDDISAYDLILKNKERLLSFEEDTRFIFSHSALREGWDNPNVFQICALKHSDSATVKRQEVGRGLRLCVNQDGSRMDTETCGESVHDINMLTVIASESYKTFVADLQNNIKEALYNRPSTATTEYFEGKGVLIGEKTIVITAQQARAIYKYLLKNDYIDDNDGITNLYRAHLANNCLVELPEDLKPMARGIHSLIQGIFDDSILDSMIEDGNKTKVQNELNENFYKKEFQTLWSYINHKYAYTVQFDSAELIQKAISHINKNLYVTQLQYTTTQAEQKDHLDAYIIAEKDSFYHTKSKTRLLKNANTTTIKYDLLGKIAKGTVLTRQTIASILQGINPDKLSLLKDNPEEFIVHSITLIKEQKATMIVEHIAYNQIDGEYDSTIFTAEKHAHSFEKALKVKKHIQNYVFTDGIAGQNNETRFANDLEAAQEVCVYAKLPRGFAIPTPVGSYTPDWAIAFKKDSVKHIYFIAETKGSMSSLDIRPIETAKINCAKSLFNKLSTSTVKYHDVTNYQILLNTMNTV